MARLIIWIVVILVVVRISYTFVRALLEGAGLKQRAGGSAVKLVRDPVCGVFVMPTRALTSRSGGTTVYLCSEKCRNEWDSR